MENVTYGNIQYQEKVPSLFRVNSKTFPPVEILETVCFYTEAVTGSVL